LQEFLSRPASSSFPLDQARPVGSPPWWPANRRRLWRLPPPPPRHKSLVRVWPKPTGSACLCWAAPGRSSGYLSSGLFPHLRDQDSERRRGKAMKGKAGAMDRRSSARWTVLALCAFSFGLGMLFTDRWFSLSPAVGSWKLWISPGGGGVLGGSMDWKDRKF
jgi:hypothetical protein